MTTRPTRGKENMGGSGAGDGCNMSHEKHKRDRGTRGCMKRHKHTDPTDNEDEKTKGKEKRIKS